MKTKLKFCLLALFMGFGILCTRAQTTTPLTDLFRLEGKWQGPAVLNLEGAVFNFTYYAIFKKNEEESGMSMVETFSHPDIGTLTGHNLIGYNNRDEKIHWFSVDNFGTCHDHLGWWLDANHFYMETTEKRGGKKFEEKIDIKFLSETHITLHLVVKLGGQTTQEVAVDFTKQ